MKRKAGEGSENSEANDGCGFLRIANDGRYIFERKWTGKSGRGLRKK
jgi:hypothetical protein